MSAHYTETVAEEVVADLPRATHEKNIATLDADGHESNAPLDKDKLYDTDIKLSEIKPTYQAVTPEVKALVPETDDPNTPCETFRAYFLGTICAILGTGLNTWFGARQPGIYINPLVAQVLVHPVGVACARWFPKRIFTTFGFQWTLNPGPWNIKEHTIVTLMAAVSLPTATALDVIIATKLPIFFNNPELGGNLGYQFLIVLSTQFLGFGMAGLARDFLVYPRAMIWPLNLAKVSLFNALHGRSVDEEGVVQVDQVNDEPVNGWKVSGFRFCLYATGASFCWLFVTDFLAPFLTYFNWPTWIAPNSKSLAILMGSVTGLGLNPLPTFDWTYMTSAGLQPLITPFWATSQLLVGAFVSLLVIVALVFSNTWYTAHIPANSNSAYDRFGKRYNTTRVIENNLLNEQKYRAYSPVYYSAGYSIVLAAHFAQYASALVYVALEHWENMKIGFGNGYRQVKALVRRSQPDAAAPMTLDHSFDIHYEIRKNYSEVPHSWFVATAVISIVMGIAACEAYHNTMPVWGIFFAFLIAALMFLPSGIIMAITNVQITITTLSEIIAGVVIPGRPHANMIFKLYGWVGLSHAQLYVQDQKLAHYLHIPPRATFRAQMWGCLVGTFISLGVLNWQMIAIKDLCVTGQKDFMTCPYYTTFFTSALKFGAIGPTRNYGPNGLYRNLLWGFLVGAGVTAIISLSKKRWPKNEFLQSVTVPILFTGASFFAPWNISYIWSGVPAAWTFMSFIRKRYTPWWNKYCYLLAIGLTVGVAVSAIIQFFCITYPGGHLDWWGTTFYNKGCDGTGCPLKPLPAVGYFGPSPGQFE